MSVALVALAKLRLGLPIFHLPGIKYNLTERKGIKPVRERQENCTIERPLDVIKTLIVPLIANIMFTF